MTKKMSVSKIKKPKQKIRRVVIPITGISPLIVNNIEGFLKRYYTNPCYITIH